MKVTVLSAFLGCMCIEEAYDHFNDTMFNVVIKYVPIKSISIRS